MLMAMNSPNDRAIRHELTIEDLNFDPPQLPDEQLREIAHAFYGIQGSFRRLEGERDQNSRIVTGDGRQFVLKIAAATEARSIVDFQIKALQHIARNDPGIAVPRVQAGTDGNLLYTTSSDKGVHSVRLLSWLPGVPYQDGPFPSMQGLYQVGQFLARLSRALAEFSHPAASQFMPWDCTNGLVFNPNLIGLLSGEVQGLVLPFLERLEKQVYPRLDQVRSQVIHQDGHGANLLRDPGGNEDVAGMIDFGDMVHGPIVCDLAVSLTDFIEVAGNPLKVACAMSQGFHSLIPLSTEELDLLLDLVIARQVLILELFEFRRRNLANPPRFVTADQPGIIAGLKMLLALDRKTFNRELSKVCK